MSKPFHFRQFSIHQDRCAMKVGTDGVLLGCYVDTHIGTSSILDIGTGTGLLALMMAQKFPQSHIDAVELDAEAAAQAQENFSNSVWGERLDIHHTSFQNYCEWQIRKYNLIVCNPPFFKSANQSKGNNLQHPSEQRAKARFSDHLPFDELVKGTARLLHRDGYFYVVLPLIEAAVLKEYCSKVGLHLYKELVITGREGARPNRIIMCWTNQSRAEVQRSELLMYHADTSPKDEYIYFTKDYYLWKHFDHHPELKL